MRHILIAMMLMFLGCGSSGGRHGRGDASGVEDQEVVSPGPDVAEGDPDTAYDSLDGFGQSGGDAGDSSKDTFTSDVYLPVQCTSGATTCWFDSLVYCSPEDGDTVIEPCDPGLKCNPVSAQCTPPEGGIPSYPVLEIADDPNSPTLNPCDAGAIKSPGADIDAAELMEGAAVLANLASCELHVGSSCEDDMDDASAAVGPPDGDTALGFVSLDGGFLRCRWEDGQEVTPNRTIIVYEIGGYDFGAKNEEYHVRLCEDVGETCTGYSGFGTGSQSFNAGALF